MSEILADESDVSVAALSRAAFAEADEPVLASAPDADSIVPAEPEADIADRIAHAVSPPAADRDAEAPQDIHDEPPVADPADPETELRAVSTPDLVPAGVLSAAEPSAPNRIMFAPDRVDMIEIGSTIARYMQDEGAAALAHFRALSDVRTPADLIRLNVNEARRAADASLTCWVTVMGKASRAVAFR
ncbi:hypothetical protein MKK88_23815 [Methylobacterium sp. E-005]|uniref:hypothetical protein n=1 Tax=Methylobacterium sp. E-005 TaxID=2836549 RepID=UPI001FBAD9CF|nr:hypothetical protein [Methylobacterium sp. E-005]MCJ2088986.1 hypothetical protein [Methylobacterium sp. E-005]